MLSATAAAAPEQQQQMEQMMRRSSDQNAVWHIAKATACGAPKCTKVVTALSQPTSERVTVCAGTVFAGTVFAGTRCAGTDAGLLPSAHLKAVLSVGIRRGLEARIVDQTWGDSNIQCMLLIQS
jgi:hypothetical protein